jgi:hypothetical protein
MAAYKSAIKKVHGLCPTCGNLDLEQVLMMNPTFEGSLILNLGPACGKWVVNSCQVCDLLAAMRPPLTILGEEMEPLALYAFGQSRYLWPISSSGVLLAVLPIQDRGIYAQKSSINTIETASFLCPVNPTGSIHNGATMKARFIAQTNIDYSIIQNWIRTCNSKHGPACYPPIMKFHTQPIFIDCTRRLIMLGPVRGGYVALSYVWGNVPVAGDFKPGSILPEALPDTIEDAITVTKKLGYRHLWVDRYCIQQGRKKKKMHQIQHMDLIYQHAEVVIIAASGKDPTSGLPGVSKKPRIYQPGATIGNHVLASTMRRPGQLIASSTWATRAWTYQEGLLARRRLVFTEEQVYFECSSMNHREAVDLEVDATELAHFGPRPGLHSRGEGGRAILQTIAAFTALKLTHESDIHNAFMGILKAYMRADPPIPSYWGVPILPLTFESTGDTLNATQGFLSGLCWQSESPGRRRPGFPSWSWLGWTGKVSSDSREYIVGANIAYPFDIAVYVSSEGAFVPWQTMWMSTYNPHTIRRDPSHRIFIAAWTIEVRLVHTSFISLESKNVAPGFYAYPDGAIPSTSYRLASMSQEAETDAELADGRPQGVYLGILLVRGDQGAEEMFVLIVRKAGDCYERIGSVQFPTMDLLTQISWSTGKKKQVIELG